MAGPGLPKAKPSPERMAAPHNRPWLNPRAVVCDSSLQLAHSLFQRERGLSSTNLLGNLAETLAFTLPQFF